MNGTGSERDDLGDTHIFPRHDGASDVDAYPGGAAADPARAPGYRPFGADPDEGSHALPSRPAGAFIPPPAPAFGPSPYDSPPPSHATHSHAAPPPGYGQPVTYDDRPGVSPRDLPPRDAPYVPPRELPPRDFAPQESPFGPPRGYDTQPRGYDTPPRGYDTQPRGFDTQPRGYDTQPRGYDTPPRGYDTTGGIPVGRESNGYATGAYQQTPYGLPSPLSESDLPRRGEDVEIDLEPLRRSRMAQQAQAQGIDIEAEERTSRRRMMPLWQELPLLLVVAFCLAVLIRTFLLQAFFIPSSSMVGTLEVGDRVLVNKIVYDVRTPDRGEVIVFRGTDNWAPETPPEPAGSLVGRIGRTLGDLVGISRPGEKDFIKRVIGLPGDRVSCCDPQGRVYVNGRAIDEPYIYNDSPLDLPPNPRVCGSRRFEEVLVPPGQVFVMGDNRLVSMDSRCQGPVPIENIIGRAFVIVWPSGRWDGLSVPDTFTDVPGPVAAGTTAPLVVTRRTAAGA